MVAFVDANGNQVQQVQQMQDQMGNIVYADAMGNPVQQVIVQGSMPQMMPDGSSTDQSVQNASNPQGMGMMGQQNMVRCF